MFADGHVESAIGKQAVRLTAAKWLRAIGKDSGSGSGNDWFDEPLADGDEGCRSAGNGDLSGSGEPPAPAPAPKRRGRKPGPRTNGPTISHVEAERQRRDKLNRRFCELRAAVPTVSRMDRASLLAAAAAYIGELRDRVEQLEAEAKQAASAAVTTAAAAAATHHHHSFGLLQGKLGLEVRMLAGLDAAALRLTTTTPRHAPAHLMLALRSLDLQVQHAKQDAVVDVPAGLRDERGLRAALLHKLQQSG
ncbi:hypothetical protein BDA96_04G233600 [Sorghum bicolor]|uniref:Transcription factor n=1 Tax=Sorghum bicolor TaxID=4558 RepID=A0A921UJL0_SORBI|nr:hypothetical protein BDA96_04G233600 [Sorghum bicolor]